MTRFLNASGCLDALVAPEIAAQFDIFLTKTVTPEPRFGNPPVRIADADVGMLNSIGLANPGIERFVDENLPALEQLGIPLWVSVGGFSSSDFAQCCKALDGHESIKAIELNVSCPNVDAPAEIASEIVAAARLATSKLLYAKLSPALPDIPSVALAAEAAGADGLSLTNTLRGMTLDPGTLQPRLSTGVGGLSGPAIRPVALAAVFACAKVSKLPILAMGGIETGEHALAFLAAGASDLALGTILFADPEAPRRIRKELITAVDVLGYASLEDVVGVSHASDEGSKKPESGFLKGSKRLSTMMIETAN